MDTVLRSTGLLFALTLIVCSFANLWHVDMSTPMHATVKNMTPVIYFIMTALEAFNLSLHTSRTYRRISDDDIFTLIVASCCLLLSSGWFATIVDQEREKLVMAVIDTIANTAAGVFIAIISVTWPKKQHPHLQLEANEPYAQFLLFLSLSLHSRFFSPFTFIKRTEANVHGYRTGKGIEESDIIDTSAEKKGDGELSNVNEPADDRQARRQGYYSPLCVERRYRRKYALSENRIDQLRQRQPVGKILGCFTFESV